MKKPDIPPNEEARLRALRSLHLLDTPPEERFDRITRLTRKVFGVPVVLITLVDEDRQWFKSREGIDEAELPRDISFCGHAILGDETFIIGDASTDERFADNPVVANAPHVRFYAGHPLRHIDGSKLGTLCIVDTIPRNMSDDDADTLRDLAQLAETEVLAIHLSTLDDLTEVMNRKGFIALAQNSLNICYRQKLQATLVFFDLNDFKVINDQFGHAEGDKALLAFASLMAETFRDSDLIARFGGDEFVVLLTDASAELTNEIIGRFQRALETYNNSRNRGYKVTFSTGLVTTDANEPQSIRSLLNQADRLMYEGKSANKRHSLSQDVRAIANALHGKSEAQHE